MGDILKKIRVESSIYLVSCTTKTKYMEVGRHRGMMVNEHITIGSNSYEKVKTFKYLGSLLTIILNIMFLHR